jgi:hypothetical protein
MVSYSVDISLYYIGDFIDHEVPKVLPLTPPDLWNLQYNIDFSTADDDIEIIDFVNAKKTSSARSSGETKATTPPPKTFLPKIELEDDIVNVIPSPSSVEESKPASKTLCKF